jgi:hypothetical protein
MDIQIGDVVKRSGHKDYGNGFGVETGDVIEKTGERCRVAWRDRMVPGFYRPEELVKRPGKRTWVNQKSLTRVPQ